MARSSAPSVSRGPTTATPACAASKGMPPPPSGRYGRGNGSSRRSTAARSPLALSSASSCIWLMGLPHRFGQGRPVDSLEPPPHPAREDEEAEAQGDVGEDESPEKDVDRPQLPRHIGGHHHRREDFADPGSA